MMKGVLGVSLVVSSLGLFVSGTLSIEMMNVIQMGYFSIAMLQESQPVLATLGELYIAINGYNRLFDFVDASRFDMNAVRLSKMLEQMREGARFLMNFNIMLFVEVALCLMTLTNLTSVTN
jgi:hypothetical protein